MSKYFVRVPKQIYTISNIQQKKSNYNIVNANEYIFIYHNFEKDKYNEIPIYMIFLAIKKFVFLK